MFPARNTQAPSAQQLAFCRKLGVKVPDGASRTEVTRLITKKKGEIAQKLFRDSGIRPGSIVRKNDGDRLLVVLNVKTDTTWGRPVSGGPGERFATCQYPDDQPPVLNMVEVCPQPEGWVHSFAVQPGPSEARGEEFSKLAQRLSDFIHERLEPEEWHTLEHGEYWRKDAVERLRRQFEIEEAAKL